MVNSEDSSKDELLSVSFDSFYDGKVHAVNEDNLPEKKIFATMEYPNAN